MYIAFRHNPLYILDIFFSIQRLSICHTYPHHKEEIPVRNSAFRYLQKFRPAILLLAVLLIPSGCIMGSGMAFGAPGPGNLAPELVSPADGSKDLSLTPELEIQFAASPAEPEATRWQVAADSAFTSLAAEEELTGNEATWTVPAGKLKAGTTYYWRVKVQYSSGPGSSEWSEWSETWSFTTGNTSGGGGCQATSAAGALGLLLPLGFVLLRRRNQGKKV